MDPLKSVTTLLVSKFANLWLILRIKLLKHCWLINGHRKQGLSFGPFSAFPTRLFSHQTEDSCPCRLQLCAGSWLLQTVLICSFRYFGGATPTRALERLMVVWRQNTCCIVACQKFFKADAPSEETHKNPFCIWRMWHIEILDINTTAENTAVLMQVTHVNGKCVSAEFPPPCM